MLFLVLLAIGLVAVIGDKNMPQPTKVAWIFVMGFFAVVGIAVLGV